MNFEAPVSEWHIAVYGEHYMGDIDIFRDIYIRLPNDGLHVTGTVVRTSALVTLQHWAQHFTSGVSNLRHKLRYGNDAVYAHFADAVIKGREPEYIGPDDAIGVLRMQHEVILKYTVL
jgi:predicted dehydrogenase